MRKLIAAINMTLDGFCDHTAMITDEEIHQHYTDLLSNAGAVLYGRTTFQLMEYWATVVKHPTGNKSMDAFAVTIDNIPKIVFSNTLNGKNRQMSSLPGKLLFGADCCRGFRRSSERQARLRLNRCLLVLTTA